MRDRPDTLRLGADLLIYDPEKERDGREVNLTQNFSASVRVLRSCHFAVLQLCLHLPHLPSPLFLSLCWSPKVGNPSDTTEQTANDAARSFKVSNCRSEEEEEEEEEGGAAGHENWQGPLDDAAWSPLASADSELRVREAPGVARASGETLPSTLGSARGGAAYSYFIHAV